MQALFVKTEEFDYEAGAGIEHQIPSQDRAGRVGLADRAIEESKDKPVSQRFVKLGGMQRHAQRNAGEIISFGILERDGPRQMALDAPAAAGRWPVRVQCPARRRRKSPAPAADCGAYIGWRLSTPPRSHPGKRPRLAAYSAKTAKRGRSNRTSSRIGS